MTTTEERIFAIENARMFMLRLLDPKATPKVPRYIRHQARARLKHYPILIEIEKIIRMADKKGLTL
jgi:hypothetical protein